MIPRTVNAMLSISNKVLLLVEEFIFLFVIRFFSYYFDFIDFCVHFFSTPADFKSAPIDSDYRIHVHFFWKFNYFQFSNTKY